MVADTGSPSTMTFVNVRPQSPKSNWGQYYDHNVLRFQPILGEKIGAYIYKKLL
jgi:hypothetical protein